MENIIPLPNTIVLLPKEQYKDYEIHFEYESEIYYDVRIHDTAKGFSADFVKMPFPEVKHKQFVDKLYEDHWEAPEAFGIFDEGKLVAVLEISPESWNRRLHILNLWVDGANRRHGLGRKLMDYAKAVMAERGYRAIILETQSCNANAITFYFSQGFVLAGFDAYAYSNEDIDKKEVRIELMYKPPRITY